MATITITGDKSVRRYLNKVILRVPKEMNKLTERMAKFIVNSAKQRVGPLKTGTGDLMRSIEYHKSQKGYTVTAGEGLQRPYAYYQEMGFKPHSVRISKLKEGSRIKNELQAGGFRGRVFVRRHTPYMGPAFRNGLKKLPNEMNRTGNKIIRG